MTEIAKKLTITAQDVATKAGVSRAAVSRTFTNNGSVSSATREKVIQAANELGYQVNFLAQGLNRKRSQLIGVVVARLSDPFRSRLLEGLLTEIQRLGYQALVTEVRTQEELADTIRRFTQFKVSGVIVTSGQPPTQLVKDCVHYNIPVVGINRYMDIEDVDFVCADNAAGASLVANQLIASGCRTFAWLNYQGSTWAGLQRGEAFQQAIETHDLADQFSLMRLTANEDGYQGGRLAAYDFCRLARPVDGIFCANAQLACGFLDGMREHGFDAPNDFHLIGFDDTPLTSQYSYRLTTVSQNIEETATRTLSCLLSKGQDTTRSQRLEVVPVRLVLRHTSPEIGHTP